MQGIGEKIGIFCFFPVFLGKSGAMNLRGRIESGRIA
jgi:hypothetical protein